MSHRWLAGVLSSFVTTINLQENYCKIRMLWDNLNLSLWYLHRVEPINSSGPSFQFFCFIKDYSFPLFILPVYNFFPESFLSVAQQQHGSITNDCADATHIYVYKITHSRTTTVLIDVCSRSDHRRLVWYPSFCSNTSRVYVTSSGC
jgi:hypothetical protein